MAQNQPKNAGWLCLWCRVMNGKHALCCHRCGGKWYEVGDCEEEDTTYAAWPKSPRQKQMNWDADAWGTGQHPKSPRHGKGKGRGKTPSPRPKQNRHKKGKKPSQHAEQLSVPSAPMSSPTLLPNQGQGTQSWMALLQMQQAANQAAQASSEATQAPPPAPAAQQQSAAMKNLLASLKKDQEKLSPENQDLLKTLQVKEERDEEKELQVAAKSLGRARRDLQEAYEARANLHQKWRTFLSMSVTQWQTFTLEFQQQESNALQQIQTAKDTLSQAKQDLETSKEAFHSPREAKNSVEVQDLMSEEDVNEDSSSSKLQEGLNHLTTSLKNLHQAAEDALAVEQATKKARLHDATDVSSLPGGKAMQPFPSPGTARP